MKKRYDQKRVWSTRGIILRLKVVGWLLVGNVRGFDLGFDSLVDYLRHTFEPDAEAYYGEGAE